MTRDELANALVAWLESERTRYLTLAQQERVPASITVPVLTATVVEEARAEYEFRNLTVSPFALDSSVPLAWFKEHAPTLPRILYEHYGERCNMWVDTAQDDEDATRRAEVLLWRTLFLGYLSALESLEKADSGLARQVIDGLLRLIEADRVDFVTALPVAGIRLPEEQLQAAGVTIRRLTNDEIGRLTELGTPDRSRALKRRAFRTFERMTVERYLLVVRKACDKTKEPSSFGAHALALALQLLGFDLSGQGDYETYTEPGPPLLASGGRIRLRPAALPYPGLIPLPRIDARELTSEDLQRAVDLTALIPNEVFTGPTSRKGIALYRFRSATCEIFPGEALLDFVTALEGLLLGERDELSFRLALFGARYLATSAAKRQTMYDQLRKIYKLRSTLVHGLGPVAPDQLANARANARELTGRLLVKALLEGWPTGKQLEQLALA